MGSTCRSHLITLPAHWCTLSIRQFIFSAALPSWKQIFLDDPFLFHHKCTQYSLKLKKGSPPVQYLYEGGSWAAFFSLFKIRIDSAVLLILVPHACFLICIKRQLQEQWDYSVGNTHRYTRQVEGSCLNKKINSIKSNYHTQLHKHNGNVMWAFTLLELFSVGNNSKLAFRNQVKQEKARYMPAQQIDCFAMGLAWS